MIKFLYTQRIITYLFVGGTTFIIDFGLLVLLYGVLNLNLAVATSISYWAAILYNFTLNRSWTFNANEARALHEHALLYSCLLAVNYLFTVTFVSLVSQFVFYTLAKVLATGIQVLWTFPTYKYIVFKTNASD